ncbi:uncharacterized protein LOC120494822 [Pimephales promelas]|uniref:uncharacterized protein LOC120494822 n=1 Tax=Pimephales promelas TaxID=90988 RepID=UPI0019555FEB|nr:uncharacterized protein LOC120494822 [Pimephales promelas]
MAKERAQFFSQGEQELLMEGYAEFQSLIKTTGNTSKSAKARREGWQKVADKLNAASAGPIRTWGQVKVKYKNILQNATKKKAEKKTGGGPAPPQYTPAEELALGLNQNRPIVEGIPGGSSSSDPKPGTSSSNTFITVLHNTPTLLPVPKQVVAEAYADREETLSDDCPLEEEPESTPTERPTERPTEESAQRSDTEVDSVTQGDIRTCNSKKILLYNLGS